MKVTCTGRRVTLKQSFIDLAEKKLAIILHNMPPRNDTIGSAHGLDTPETVFRVIRAL